MLIFYILRLALMLMYVKAIVTFRDLHDPHILLGRDSSLISTEESHFHLIEPIFDITNAWL